MARIGDENDRVRLLTADEYIQGVRMDARTIWGGSTELEVIQDFLPKAG